MSNSPSALKIIEGAFDKLASSVTADDQRSFQSTTLHDVRKAALDIEKWQRERKCMQNIRRLEPFLDGIRRFSSAIDILCNGTPFLPWIWAPVKLVLQIASDYSTGFGNLLDAYAQIAATLPRLDRYQHALPTPEFHNSLAVMYRDILEFHGRVYKFLRRRAWNIIFDSLWKGFQHRFHDILKRLSETRDVIDREAVSFDILESSRSRQRLEGELDKIENDRTSHRLQEALTWVASEDRIQEDYLTHLHDLQHVGTCEWILSNEEYNNWLQGREKFLWIWGIPGSGKSILAAHIIRALRVSSPRNTFYYFFRFSTTSEDDCGQLLRCLATQIIRTDDALGLHVTDNYVQKRLLNSIDQMTKLLPELLSTITAPRVVIDGLDECSSRLQKVILTKLLALLENSRDCTLLFLSRDGGEIEKLLRYKPRLSLQEQGHLLQNDISIFVKDFLRDLRNLWTFDVSDDMVDTVEQKLLEGAKGMFLWVKLVLSSLEFQYSVEDIVTAIRRLPRDLTSAYNRTFDRIMDIPDTETLDKTRRIFQWLTYSRRPLKVFEILSGVALNPDTLVTEPRVLGKGIMHLCKPVVEISNSGVVDFVHFSAKEYLLTNSSQFYLDPLDAHLSIALLSIAYLNTTKRLLDETQKSCEKREILMGKRGIHRYVLSFWFDHLLSMIKLQEKKATDLDLRLKRSLESISWLRKEMTSDNSHEANPLRLFQDLSELYYFLVSIYQFKNTISNREYKHGTIEGLREDIIESDPSRISEVDQAYENHIEAILDQLAAQSTEDPEHDLLEAFQQSQGGAYFCRYERCKNLSQTFTSKEKREKHESTHVRAFKCPLSYCVYESIGFKKMAGLDQHCRLQHPQIYKSGALIDADSQLLDYLPKKSQLPVDIEKQCGVPLPHGNTQCRRSLTCKTHSMGAKRDVPGRSLPYDMLLAAYNKMNQIKRQKNSLSTTDLPKPTTLDGIAPAASDSPALATSDESMPTTSDGPPLATSDGPVPAASDEIAPETSDGPAPAPATSNETILTTDQGHSLSLNSFS